MRKLSRSTFINAIIILIAISSYGQENEEIKRIDSLAKGIDSIFQRPVFSLSDTIVVYICFTDPPVESPVFIETLMFFGDESCRALRKYTIEISKYDISSGTSKVKSLWVRYYYDDELIKTWEKDLDSISPKEKVFYFSKNTIIGVSLSGKNEQIDLKRIEKGYLSEVQSDLNRFKTELGKLKVKETSNY